MRVVLRLGGSMSFVALVLRFGWISGSRRLVTLVLVLWWGGVLRRHRNWYNNE